MDLINDYETYLQAYLDGELSPTETLAFERHTATRPEFAERLASEQRLRARWVLALRTPVASAEKEKALARFREALALELREVIEPEAHGPGVLRHAKGDPDSDPDPQLSGAATSHRAATPSRREANGKAETPIISIANARRRRSRIMTAVAGVAAGILLVTAWQAGWLTRPQLQSSDSPCGVHHSEAIECLWQETTPYYAAVGLTEKKPHIDRSRRGSFWAASPANADSPLNRPESGKRLAEVLPEAAALLPPSLADLRIGNPQLLSARMINLKVGGRTIRAPHVSLAEGDDEVSGYFFKATDAALVFETLMASVNAREVEIQLHECAPCAIVSRKFGDHVALFFSCSAHEKLRATVMRL